MKKFYATVVDYSAWENGYMPPSEHILIDQLSYRGAKVLTGCDFGDYAFWIVMRGKRPRREIMKKITELLSIECDFYEPEKTDESTQGDAGTPTPEGTSHDPL